MENTNTAEKARPGILTALCICSLIWGGLMMLLSLIGIFASGWIMSLLGGIGGGAIGGYFAIIMVVSLLFWFLSFFGALKMMKLKKSGFIMYAIPNGLMLIFQIIGIVSAFTPFSLIYLLVSIVFLVLYGMNLKHMS